MIGSIAQSGFRPPIPGQLNPLLSTQQTNVGQISFGDIDPITPGVQTQRGILTATGPSTYIGGGGSNFGATGMITSGVNGASGFIGGIDPVASRIQSQSGVVTPIGLPQGNGIVGINASGYNQNVGVMGSSKFNTGVGAAGYSGLNYGITGGVDLDPITPGVQSQPGIVTAIGPSRVISRGGFCNCCNCCPWWLWALLGLLLLGSLIGGLYAFYKSSNSNQSSIDTQNQNEDTTTTSTSINKKNNNQDDKQEQNDKQNEVSEGSKTTTESQCKNGFRKNGKCIVCPDGSEWNGNTCSYETSTEIKNQQKTTVGAIDGQNPQGQDLAATKQTTKTQTTQSSSNKKVPVFVQAGEQNINQALKNAKQEQGSQPELITSKPTNTKPNYAINAAGGTEQSNTDIVSNNIVTVPAITQKKSIPAITREKSSNSCKFGESGCSNSHPYIGYGNSGSYNSKQGSSSSINSSSSSLFRDSQNIQGSQFKNSQTRNNTQREQSLVSNENSNTQSKSEVQNSQSGSSKRSIRNKTRTVTRIKTTYRDQIVDPIITDPSHNHKHMRRDF